MGVRTLTTQNGLLAESDIKSELSHAYLHALAVESGYNYLPGPQPDRLSIDAMILSGEITKAQIDVQLKATSSPRVVAGNLHFRLGFKNYNDLREIPRRNPIILVVLELPRDRNDWLDCDGEGLTLRRRAWWLSLADYPEIDSQTKMVELPQTQLLTPDSLKRIMASAREWDLSSRSLRP